MKYFTITPPSSLAPYVRYFWVLEGEGTVAKPYVHRSMADGCAELIFHYNGVFDELMDNNSMEKSFSSGLSGQSQRYRRFVIRQNFGIFGAYVYPFAVPQLFSISGTEIKNQMLDLKTAIGNQGTEIEERMMLAPDNNSRVRTIVEFLERKLVRSFNAEPGVFSAIKHIIKTNGVDRVDALAERAFQSTRQFERNFKHYSGFSPKLFSRIVRFQSALGKYHGDHKSLSEIAYDCGYYDQSHFIQDFREFSGYSPLEYFSGRTEATEWRD